MLTTLRNPGHKRRGMALLEALVAGAILAVGLAVLVSIAGGALSAQKLGEDRVIVASLADQLLNEVLAEGPEVYLQTYDLEGTFAAPFSNYSYQMIIEPQGETQPHFVSVTIEWLSGGRRRTETVDTLISSPRDDENEQLREPGTPIAR